ncbi:transport system permease protein [Thermoanaerobacter mathranii subsp. mathranii str. A3]|uniref:Transport system permease protein n=1 Tax=Thermoanaerobacter mathranii subsp. mathranii (strain DSM 11426 / CCUG 53645 / CIP 108742 / A3) TaxID=583358 RepID=A0ABN3Z373_THEM3|nr:iron ABC transporter permease [Thermoanaerobacter mathranii]ADH61363.1 transport system permease protein [Thermoanaerobacter mathranii subsp. mathranii str. A3]
MRQSFIDIIPESYNKYIKRKVFIILLTVLLTLAISIYAINAGSAGLSVYDVMKTILGKGEERFQIIVWNIRFPRILSAIVAGIGLSVAGCVTQSILRNSLASPFTLGISQGAAFGAAVAVIVFGAGSTTNPDSVIVNNPYLVVFFAFLGSMASTIVVLMLAKSFRVTPEAMVLAGVALGSLFSAVTMILQYFADDVRVASVVFWTFGDIGRVSWKDLGIMSVVVGISLIYFMFNRWNYNALDSGEETAKGLGVEVERVRLLGMFVSSLIAAVITSFVGIIGFIGLVAPHIMRRLIGGDHRFLIPASSVMGGLILLASDTLGRTIISPIVLPVGAITSFLGAPVFLYVLSRGYKR